MLTLEICCRYTAHVLEHFVIEVRVVLVTSHPTGRVRVVADPVFLCHVLIPPESRLIQIDFAPARHPRRDIRRHDSSGSSGSTSAGWSDPRRRPELKVHPQ